LIYDIEAKGEYTSYTLYVTKEGDKKKEKEVLLNSKQ